MDRAGGVVDAIVVDVDVLPLSASLIPKVLADGDARATHVS